MKTSTARIIPGTSGYALAFLAVAAVFIASLVGEYLWLSDGRPLNAVPLLVFGLPLALSGSVGIMMVRRDDAAHARRTAVPRPSPLTRSRPRRGVASSYAIGRRARAQARSHRNCRTRPRHLSRP